MTTADAISRASDLLLTLLIIVMAISVMIWSYKTGARYMLFVSVLLWFMVSIFNWGKADATAATVRDIFWILRMLGITMAIITTFLVMIFKPNIKDDLADTESVSDKSYKRYRERAKKWDSYSQRR